MTRSPRRRHARLRRPGAWLGALLAAAVAVPWIAGDYYVSLLFFLFLAIVLTETYDLVAGYMGYVNLGHGAFFGIGAYLYGITVARDGGSALGLLLAALAATLFAGIIAYPLFKLRDAYFAIATFGVLKLMEVLAANLRGMTGGTTGLSIVPADSTLVTYYLAILLCVAAIALNAWVARSRFGLGLLTIREDEAVAEASGVDTVAFKRRILMLSAVLPALAGAVYVWQTTYVDPASAFGSAIAFAPVIMAMLGGSGTVAGPVIGAIFLTIVQETLWSHVGHLQLTMYGVVLVIVGMVMPGGLLRSNFLSRVHAAVGLPDHYGYRPSRASRHAATSRGTTREE